MRRFNRATSRILFPSPKEIYQMQDYINYVEDCIEENKIPVLMSEWLDGKR